VVNVVADPVQRCGYEFVISDDAEINAAATGDLIILNRGILRFARSEEEIALVVAHELAHNAMRHIQAMQQNQTMGLVGGALIDVLAAAGGVDTGGAFTRAGGDIGARMFSRDFESEADYVGMYFLARAGYSIDGVEDFWRRMAVEHPEGVRLAYSHPTYAERFVSLPSVRQEIADKTAAGAPLIPNMRE
jgi:predicted Zn-dependent protease